MPRRRPEPPLSARLAAILGIPSAASPGAASPPLAGWVPQRTVVVCPPALSPAEGEVAGDAVEAGQTVVDDGRDGRSSPPYPAILTVPVALRGLRARPRRLAVLGILVLLVAAVAVLGIRVAWARSSARPTSIAASAHGPPGGLVSRTAPAAFASGAATSLPSAASVLLVHVVGQVRRPGVVRLPPGSRVLDAVGAAGGALRSADLNHLNLARVVADGEQIVVPKPGEALPMAGATGGQGAGTGSADQGSTAGATGGLVDLNTADAAALDSLPGVGPVLSQRILDWRTQHGRFSSVDELGEVSGIGDKLMAQLGPRVRV